MLLERRIVKILNDYTICNGLISRDDFVDYVLKKKWPRINYHYYYRDDAFKRKIENVIDDCVEYKFIINKDASLRVTKEGRDYLKLIGFIEEFLKRRKRTVVIPVSVIFGAVAAYLTNYFLNK